MPEDLGDVEDKDSLEDDDEKDENEDEDDDKERERRVGDSPHGKLNVNISSLVRNAVFAANCANEGDACQCGGVVLYGRKYKEELIEADSGVDATAADVISYHFRLIKAPDLGVVKCVNSAM